MYFILCNNHTQKCLTNRLLLYIIKFCIEEQSWLRDGIFSGFEIGIFNFMRDRKLPKILKSRESGSQLKNPDWKIPKSRDQDRDFESLNKYRTSPESQIPNIESRDFYSRDSAFFSVLRFKSPGFGIFLNSGIFIPRIYAKSPGFGIFSVRWDIPSKSHLW